MKCISLVCLGFPCLKKSWQTLEYLPPNLDTYQESSLPCVKGGQLGHLSASAWELKGLERSQDIFFRGHGFGELWLVTSAAAMLWRQMVSATVCLGPVREWASWNIYLLLGPALSNLLVSWSWDFMWDRKRLVVYPDFPHYESDNTDFT